MDQEMQLMLVLPLVTLMFMMIVLPAMGFTHIWKLRLRPPPRIVVLGDSLAFGNGAHLNMTGPEGFPELHGRGNYTNRLNELLQQFQVFNASLPNATVIEIPESAETASQYSFTPEHNAAMTSSPRVAVVMLGTVDFSEENAKYAGVLSSSFRQELHNIAERLLHLKSLQLVVMCVPPLVVKSDISSDSLGKASTTTEERATDLMDALKHIMRDLESIISMKQMLDSSKADWACKKVVLVDMHKTLVLQPRQKDALFHTADAQNAGVGLTPAGAEVVAETLAVLIARELNFELRTQIAPERLSKKLD